MIIAHGPIGYLLAFGSRNYWQTMVTAKQRTWLFVVAFVGGIFPDIDLFYFYFVDSSLSHRQFITHSLIPYTMILIMGLCMWRWSKLKRVGAGLVLFAVGACSHILADMLIGQAAIWLPFSDTLWGLVSMQWYRNSWLMQNRLATNFMAEYIFITLAVSTFVKRTRIWWMIVVSVGGVVLATLLWLSHHSYQPNGYFYYGDQDSDGVLNAYDRDSDGDGVLNIDDAEVTSDVLYTESFSARGSLFDYSFGNLLEIPRRLGAVNDAIVTARLFSNNGIFFGEEMKADFKQQTDGYHYTPTDNRFNLDVRNWRTWLQHQNRLTQTPKEFDLAFFSSGYVGVLMYDERGAVILDSHPSHWLTQMVPLDEVVTREGNIETYGRIIGLVPSALPK